jgi:hypothetical protein
MYGIKNKVCPFIGEGVLSGAAWGAAFAGVSASIEGIKNYREGYGFGTNDGRVTSMVHDAVEDYTSKIDPIKAQNTLDFIKKRYKLNGVKFTYDEKLPDFGSTNLSTGDVRIGPGAFDNGYTGWRDPSILKATMAHEFGHSTIDRIMKGGRLTWKSGSGAGWNFGDGAIGYESEIRLAAKMHINPKSLRSTINSSSSWSYGGRTLLNQQPWNPIWYSGTLKNKWLYLIPKRF